MIPVLAHRAGRRSLRRRRARVHEISVRITEIAWQQDLEGHPKAGASWEGFILDQIVQHLGARPEECHFWRTHTGAELDLLVVRGRHRLGFEIKRTTAPAITRSMRSAMQDLKLSALTLVHAGDETFPLGKNIGALSWKDVVAGHRNLQSYRRRNAAAATERVGRTRRIAGDFDVADLRLPPGVLRLRAVALAGIVFQAMTAATRPRCAGAEPSHHSSDMQAAV